MGNHRRWAIGLLTILLLICLYGVVGAVHWRGTGSGTPLQDPMIYSNQYIYPRAWTRSQLAPGVYDPDGAEQLASVGAGVQTFAEDRAVLEHLVEVQAP